jgi:hypothetical protein
LMVRVRPGEPNKNKGLDGKSKPFFLLLLKFQPYFQH